MTKEQDNHELRLKAGVTGLIDKYWDLEPWQVEAAYEGYKQKMCDLGNTIIIAVRRAFSDSEPFVYSPDHTREDTFKRFNIKED